MVPANIHFPELHQTLLCPGVYGEGRILHISDPSDQTMMPGAHASSINRTQTFITARNIGYFITSFLGLGNALFTEYYNSSLRTCLHYMAGGLPSNFVSPNTSNDI